MTWDQYWYGDVWMVEAFREADRLRQERMNEQLWLQGLYVFDAMSCAVQNGNRTKKTDPIAKYPPEPYDFFLKKEKETVPKLSEEEIYKKKAQVRGLQALLYGH